MCLCKRTVEVILHGRVQYMCIGLYVQVCTGVSVCTCLCVYVGYVRVSVCVCVYM